MTQEMGQFSVVLSTVWHNLCIDNRLQLVCFFSLGTVFFLSVCLFVCACRYHGSGKHWLTVMNYGSSCASVLVGPWHGLCHHSRSLRGSTFALTTLFPSRELLLLWWVVTLLAWLSLLPSVGWWNGYQLSGCTIINGCQFRWIWGLG